MTLLKDGYHEIQHSLIKSSKFNERKFIEPTSLNELAASVKEKGILEPCLVRPLGKFYELMAGERRWRAAAIAKLKIIPCIVRKMTDEQALEVNIIENLMRVDVHPLDEAAGFEHLRNVAKIEIKEIARRVGKNEKYVMRRLYLLRLIDEARDDFRKGLITLGHALELSRLAPEVQARALAACYESKWVKNVRTVDKSEPAHSVGYLQNWLQQNVLLNLSRAPFSTTDKALREDRLTCVECPQRSGFNRGLFDDVKGDDVCTNPICFNAKIASFVQITRDGIEKKDGKPARVVTSGYYTKSEFDPNSLSTEHYRQIRKGDKRCEFAERAVLELSNNKFQVVTICAEKKCKDHMGHYSGSSSGGSSTPKVSLAQHHKRKQEIFDIKVAELTRRRVFLDAVPTFRYPLDLSWLQRIAAEFFVRIPGSDQDVIREVLPHPPNGLKWTDKDLPGFASDVEDLIKQIQKHMVEDDLAQLLALCSFAHYGENNYGHNAVDQSRVYTLAKERKGNYALRDAEARVELSSKKCLPRHQAYLAAVVAGQAASVPKIYDEAPKPPAKASKKKSAAKKSAKKR